MKENCYVCSEKARYPDVLEFENKLFHRKCLQEYRKNHPSPTSISNKNTITSTKRKRESLESILASLGALLILQNIFSRNPDVELSFKIIMFHLGTSLIGITLIISAAFIYWKKKKNLTR